VIVMALVIIIVLLIFLFVGLLTDIRTLGKSSEIFVNM
jgi:hypothetical protein